MNARYLVDTDWAVYFLSAQPAVTRRLREARAQGLALSVASLAELYEGVTTPAIPRKANGD